MTDIYIDILDPRQQELVSLVSQFSSSFYLVGGTALALQLGHRRSLDFDLFSFQQFENQHIRNRIKKVRPIDQTVVDQRDELTIIVHGVRCTFFCYPYRIPHPLPAVGALTMPDQLTIAAMKAFAIGRRAKWKDYVDLYFIFQHYALADVVGRATELFGHEVDEKIFREQLAYHKDINYTEEVVYMPGRHIPHKTILSSLLSISTS